MINLSNKDIYWSYFARFLDITSGIIILPLILMVLTPEEIGMNYLMLTIGSLVSLFDFGFAPQFARNITYVFSGVKELKKEGLEFAREKSDIDYRLLATMIQTAKFVYRRLSIVVIILMLTFGSIYVYYVTDGFINVRNALIIWLIFSISVFFNIYYTYYSSLLTGRGLIKESSIAKVYTRILYIIFTLILLYFGVGLLSIVIAGLITPFVKRHISHKYFYTKELKDLLVRFKITDNEKVALFELIWHNSKKLGIVFICTFITTKFGLFIAGLFLPLNDIASFGLMLQLIGFISSLSITLFEIYQPRFSFLRTKGDNELLIKEFAFSMIVFYIIYFVGVFSVLLFGQQILNIIGSNTALPSFEILLIYSVVILFELNHSNYATLITTRNEIPFVKPAIIGSVVMIAGSFLILKYSNFGILGLILVQGLTESAYDNWKWPMVVHKELNLGLKSFLNIGFNELLKRIKIYVNDKYRFLYL